MNVFTVCFFGHREIDNFNDVEENINEIINNLICNREYVEFLVGKNGEFDDMVSSAIKKSKNEISYIRFTHTLVLPYITAEYINNKNSFENYYDNIEVFDTGKIYYKTAFRKRNRYMIDKSDLCVFYVNHNYGGAYEALKYAKSIGKTIYKV